MSRVLVTGATGFVGGHLAAAFGDAEVTAVGRNRSRLRELQSDGLQVDQIDLGSPDAADRLSGHRPELIVHAAARSSPWGTAQEFQRANVDATSAVLTAATRAQAPVIYLSTPSVYMDRTNQLMVSEDDPLPSEFVNDYTATKHQGEVLVRDFVADTGLPAAILRPQAIVGAGDTTLAPRFLKIIDRGIMPLFDGGTAVLDMTSVHNVVAATELTAQSLIEGRLDDVTTLNVTNGEPRTVASLFEMIVDIRSNKMPDARTPKRVSLPSGSCRTVAGLLEKLSLATGSWEPPLTQYSVDSLAYDRTLDISRARETLGYTPEVHGIEEAIEGYFSHSQAML